MRSRAVATGQTVFTEPAQFGVGGLTHQFDQLVPVAEVDRLGADVSLGVCGAVPVEVVPASPPASTLVLADHDLEILSAVGALDVAVGAPDRQLPANIRLGLHDADATVDGKFVQRTTGARRKARPVQENAGTVDDLGLSAAVLVLLGDLLGAVELPVIGAEFFGPLLDPLLVGLVGEVRAERAASVVWPICIDSLAPGAEDAGPVARQPGEVAAEDLTGVNGVGELDPGTRKVEAYFGHGVSVRPARAGSVIGMEVGTGEDVRLGVLDVGSNTVHLLVVDAHHGAAPRSAYSYKTELRLAEFLDDDGGIDEVGVSALTDFVGEAAKIAEQVGAEEMLAFATSAIREASNGDAVLRAVRSATGVDLEVLSGVEEARLTFLAVRRWFGWSSGRMLVLDIGGGSLEVGIGTTEEPEAAFSLPLGAGRLTRAFLSSDPPTSSEVKHLRRHVRQLLAEQREVLDVGGTTSHAVGTSKTFKQLARLTGAAPSSAGPYVERYLHRVALADWVPRLAGMSAKRRAELPGISPGRAPQLLAGAIVAELVMEAVEVDTVEICPWALREGVILRRLDWMGQ